MQVRDDDPRLAAVRQMVEAISPGASFFALIIEKADGTMGFCMTSDDHRFVRCARKLKAWTDAWFSPAEECDTLTAYAEGFARLNPPAEPLAPVAIPSGRR
jgi:hypothetical protein